MLNKLKNQFSALSLVGKAAFIGAALFSGAVFAAAVSSSLLEPKPTTQKESSQNVDNQDKLLVSVNSEKLSPNPSELNSNQESQPEVKGVETKSTTNQQSESKPTPKKESSQDSPQLETPKPILNIVKSGSIIGKTAKWPCVETQSVITFSYLKNSVYQDPTPLINYQEIFSPLDRPFRISLSYQEAIKLLNKREIQFLSTPDRNVYASIDGEVSFLDSYTMCISGKKYPIKVLVLTSPDKDVKILYGFVTPLD